MLYQKELFVGVAHELKTPLAVMKTKNEVTLIKPRESEKYIETLKNNNEAIDHMNKNDRVYFGNRAAGGRAV